MRRRDFLESAVATAAGAVLSVSCADESAGGFSAEVKPAIAAALGDAAVRQLGRTYVAHTPTERTYAALRRALRRARRQQRGSWWRVAPTMEQVVANDFSAGRTVFVDGWMLSVNEARHCGLVSLAAG